MNTALRNRLIRWRLKEVMKERGITNRELARRVGMHEFSIARLKGYDVPTNVNMATLDKLCAALQCNPGDLIQYEPGEGGQ